MVSGGVSNVAAANFGALLGGCDNVVSPTAVSLIIPCDPNPGAAATLVGGVQNRSAGSQASLLGGRFRSVWGTGTGWSEAGPMVFSP